MVLQLNISTETAPLNIEKLTNGIHYRNNGPTEEIYNKDGSIRIKIYHNEQSLKIKEYYENGLIVLKEHYNTETETLIKSESYQNIESDIISQMRHNLYESNIIDKK